MSIVRSGVFEIDTQSRELRKRGARVRLADQSMRVLLVLLEHPGRLVTREQLQRTLWPDGTFVAFDAAINKAINEVRHALDDSAANPRFVETLPKRGYRFIAPVHDAEKRSPRSDRIASLVVLPFENLTGKPSQQFLADGITDALITCLSSIGNLSVISRTSAMSCKRIGKSLQDIGRDLSVDGIVEGSVLRSDSNVRIIVRLVEVCDERIVWHGQLEARSDDLLRLYDEVGQNIASELGRSSKVPRARRSPGRVSVHPDAQIEYIKGRYLWNRRTATDLYASLEHFTRAIELDTEFASAYAGLADGHVMLGIFGLQPPATAFGRAREAATRALELDDDLAEAHTCMAEVLKDYDWDWTNAEREYERALALNPSYSTAHHWYAQLLVSLKRYDEARAEIELARRTDPLSVAINSYVPYIYLAARQYDRALREAMRAIEFEPYSPLAYWELGRAYLFSGASQHGVTALERATELAGALSMWEAELSFARARAGDHAGALAIHAALQRRAEHEYVSPYDLAVSCAGLGDHTAALEYLEQSFDER